MKCSHCGAEFEGNFCTACGAKAEPCPQPSPEIPADRPRSQKPKKPIYKKWWFYVIVAVVVIAIAGRISGGSKSEKIDWDDMVLGAQLPQPPAKKGQIHTNTADELWVDIEKTSDKQYADYVQACQTVGFTVDAESNSSSFSAYNAEGYKLKLSYYENGEELSIRLEKPMEMGPANSLLSMMTISSFTLAARAETITTPMSAPAGIRALRSTTIRATTIIVPITTRGGMSRSIMWATRS